MVRSPPAARLLPRTAVIAVLYPAGVEFPGFERFEEFQSLVMEVRIWVKIASRKGVGTMPNQQTTRFRFLAGILLTGLILSLQVCTARNKIPPEVSADFNFESSGRVSVSPDPIYVKAGKQKVHWHYKVDRLEIRFGDDRPFPDPDCKNGNCVSDIPGTDKIRDTPYKYTVSGSDKGKPFQLDPRLIIGN